MSTIEEATAAITASSPESSVYIGCDSIRYSKKINGKKLWFARYCTVVIVHKDSSHGCTMFYQIETIPDFGNIHQRMMSEVGYTVEVAVAMKPYIGKRHWEIHLDINKSAKFKSNSAMSEARGWVLGTFGFEPMFKPNGFAATHCADHLVRYKN